MPTNINFDKISGVTKNSIVIKKNSIDPDAQAFITAAAITNPTQKTAVNALVLSLKADGIWTKMKAIYPFVGGTASSHKFNLKNTTQYQITWVGGVTHNSNGVTGNGLNGYGNTGLADNVLSASNKHLSMYQRNVLSTVSGASMGIASSNRFYLNYAGQNYSSLAIAQAPYAVVTPQKGFMCLAKVSATPLVFKYYQNALTPTSRTSAALSSIYNHVVLASNNESTNIVYDFSVANLALASIGDGLTNTDYTNLKVAVESFQTALGRNV